MDREDTSQGDECQVRRGSSKDSERRSAKRGYESIYEMSQVYKKRRKPDERSKIKRVR